MAHSDPLRILDAARLYEEQCLDVAQRLPTKAPAGLRGQLTEAAQAVSDILAEGLGRGTVGEKIRYSRMAMGSLEESQNQLRRCMRRKLIDEKWFYKVWNLSVVLTRMFAGFIAHLERDQHGD